MEGKVVGDGRSELQMQLLVCSVWFGLSADLGRRHAVWGSPREWEDPMASRQPPLSSSPIHPIAPINSWRQNALWPRFCGLYSLRPL